MALLGELQSLLAVGIPLARFFCRLSPISPSRFLCAPFSREQVLLVPLANKLMSGDGWLRYTVTQELSCLPRPVENCTPQLATLKVKTLLCQGSLRYIGRGVCVTGSSFPSTHCPPPPPPPPYRPPTHMTPSTPPHLPHTPPPFLISHIRQDRPRIPALFTLDFKPGRCGSQPRAASLK